VVGIDEWDVENITNPAAHLNAVPADGTFINTSTGHVYRIAGGAPFAVSSWSVFGGEQPYVTVDEWDIDNASNAAAHLNQTPANGTIVEGLPSGTYWSFIGGYRSQTLASSTAVGVDDIGLASFPERQTPVGGTGGAAHSGGGASVGGGTSNGSPGTGGTGARGASCVVPKLRGMSLQQARKALTHAACSLGKVRRPRHVPRHAVLKITIQSVEQGSSRPSGYPVNVTLRAFRT
jgi:hypothetical protein